MRCGGVPDHQCDGGDGGEAVLPQASTQTTPPGATVSEREREREREKEKEKERERELIYIESSFFTYLCM